MLSVFLMVSIVYAQIGEDVWAENNSCFGNNKVLGSPADNMDFLYRHFPANYTTIREYWLKKDTECDFIVDSDNYVDWYISDVKASF